MATQETRSELITIVVAMFDAAPGTAVLSDLVAASDAGSSNAQIAANLAGTAEFRSIYPTFLTNEEFANNFVDNMVGTLVSEDEKDIIKDYLTGELNAGASRVDVVLSAVEALSAIPADDAVWGDASAAFANKVEVAEYHTVTKQQATTNLEDLQTVLAGVDNTDASVANAKDEIDGISTVGTTYPLTASSDVIDGGSGDDTFVGLIDTDTAANSTLNVSDVISGGAGTDKMQLTVVGTAAGSLPAADINGVENFFIRDVAGTASTYNFANVTGEAQVWTDRSTNDVTFSNLGTGTVVGLQGNGATALGDVSFNMATATAAVNIVAAGGVGTGTPAVTATAGSATTATLTSTGATNALGAVTLTGAAASVTSLTIDAQSALSATLVATDYATTSALNIKGSGNVTLTNPVAFTTIAAGDLTGNLTTDINAATAKVTSGAGNDTLTLTTGLTSGASINLGAGNDTLLSNGGSIGSSVVVDGGAGTNSIAASLINAANAANIKNFQSLDLSGATASALDVELVTGSAIQALTLNGGAGGSTVTNVAAGVGLAVKGNNTGTTTIGVKGAATGTSDAFTVNFAGTTGTVAAGTVVLNKVENVTIASNGTTGTNTITLTSDTLKTATITGAKDATVAFGATTGSVAPGAGVTAGVTSIDGSAATGDLTINTTNVTAATAGLTVMTGSGDDTITLAQKATVSAGAGDDTIVVSAAGGTLTGGAGEDTFDVTLAVSTGVTEATAVLTTITDFSAGDSIDFAAGVAFNSDMFALDGTVTNLDLALDAAGDSNAAGEISWFQYSGNTYIVADTDATLGFSAGDTVVKLTGLVDLSDASLAATVLTLA